MNNVVCVCVCLLQVKLQLIIATTAEWAQPFSWYVFGTAFNLHSLDFKSRIIVHDLNAASV